MTGARPILALAVLLAVAPAGTAAAGESARVRRALDEMRAARRARGAGIDGLAAFANEVEARRAALNAAAARPLPPKATERLAEARAAFEAGHGRLLDLLREIAADPATARAKVEEARALAARIEAAERREPYSADLRVRAPRLQAPALDSDRDSQMAVAATATDERPIGPVPALLREVASSLGGALEIYTLVRNSITPELYHGRLKGAVQTWLEKSGNDADTAAVLVELLRGKGIPARYVVGTAEVPAATLLRMVGTAGSIEDAARALERAGVPHEPVMSGGGISSVRMARVWVEAYVPYVNYRGLDIDAQGKAWVPLDAAFKLFDAPGGLDVVGEVGFDPRATFDAYFSEPPAATPREFVQARIEALLATQKPGVAYAQVLAGRTFRTESLGLLPNTLPYVASGGEASYALPDTLRHRVRLRARAGTNTVLEHELDASDVLADRVTIDYEPFDDDDRAVVALFGGLRLTPPFLFQVRPILRLGGVPVAGGGPIGFGVKYEVLLDLVTPAGTETVTNTLLAGNLVAIGFGGRRGTTTETRDDEAARILAGIALAYLDRWNQSDAELAALLRVVPIRPTLSLCFAMSDVEVEYAGGDPLFPLSFEWKGVAVDADFRPMAPVGIERRERERDFALLSGLEGSVLEERVLTAALQVESISTVSALQLAHAQGVAVVDVTSANADVVVAGLPYDDGVKAEVLAAAHAGQLVRIAVAPVSRLAWTGVGYTVLDEETGEAAYQLQGGHSGGVTAAAVDGFPPALGAVLAGPGAESADCRSVDRPAASVEIASDPLLLGVVDKKLDGTLKVRAKDAEGQPIKGACVTFTGLVGAGKLVLPGTQQEGGQVVVRADDSGIASVEYRLGKSTRDVPRFLCEDGRDCTRAADPDQYTQVGMNQVTASSGPAHLKEPFTFYALPDGQCGDAPGGACKARLVLTSPAIQGGPFQLSVAGLMQVAVLDPHGNPLSNFDVRFAAPATAKIAAPPAGWSLYREQPTATPAKVLKLADYRTCTAANVSPGLGDCAGEAGVVTVRSSPTGAFAYAVVGDSAYSHYEYDIGSTETPRQVVSTFATVGFLCRSPSRTDCEDVEEPTTLVVHGTRPRRVNRHGDFIEAYPVGSEGDLTLHALSIEEENEVYESGAPDQFGPRLRARGTNKYKRRRLEDSVFTGSGDSPGTAVTPARAAHIGQGQYRTSMRMSSTPQRNVAVFDSQHRPPVIRYMREFRSLPHADFFRLDPGNVSQGVAQRSPTPSGTWRGKLSFDLWGAKVEIADVFPRTVLLAEGAGGVTTTAHSVQAKHAIQPEAWRRLLDPWLVFFTVKDPAGAIVAATRAGDAWISSDRFSVPRGAALSAGTHNVHLEVESVSRDTATTPSRGIPSAPRPLPASRVNLVTDANNDTRIDDTDVTTLRTQPGATFEFWEGDPDREAKTEGARAVSEEVPLQILEEYAAVRVVLDEALPLGDLYLRLRDARTGLYVAPHIGASGECGTASYVCSLASAERQHAQRLALEVRSDAVGIAILPAEPKAGNSDYIFRVTRGAGADALPLRGVLELVRDVDGVKETVLERNVRIRRVQSLMSVFSARLPSDEERVSPLPHTMVAGDWASLPEAKDAPRVFVFVHGYNVPLSNALDRWFPLVFKRLYWAGVPIIPGQRAKREDEIYMAGFTWAGNEGTIIFSDDSPYPTNEFNAMQTAVPLSVLLTEGGTHGLGGRHVQVMAHSLGNMVVNEALSMLPAGTVKRYIMNEAAVSAEAFATSRYLQNDLERDRLDADTLEWGFPEDAHQGLFASSGNWVRQWRDMQIEKNVPSTSCGHPQPEFPTPPGPSDFRRWEEKLENLRQLNPNVPEPAYETRWRLFPDRSAWTGVYKEVPRRTELVNTFNPNDEVITLRRQLPLLTSGWLGVQQYLKPTVGTLLGLLPDDRCHMFWAPLRDQDEAQQNLVWTYGRSNSFLPSDLRSPAGIGRLTRRWGERAYWFASRSGTAGSQNLMGTQNPMAGTVEERSFEAHGLDRHSYMYRQRALPALWPAYRFLAEVLQRR